MWCMSSPGLSKPQTTLLQLYVGLLEHFPSELISFPPSLHGFMCGLSAGVISGLKQNSQISILPPKACRCVFKAPGDAGQAGAGRV